MDLMSRITKGAAGAALGGSSGASMGGAVVGCITSVGGTVFGRCRYFLRCNRRYRCWCFCWRCYRLYCRFLLWLFFRVATAFFILNILLSSLMRRHTFLQQDLSVP